MWIFFAAVGLFNPGDCLEPGRGGGVGRGMKTGLSLLRDTEAQIRKVVPGSPSEITKKSEELGACLVLRGIFEAGLARRESLGSFERRDFPEEPERSAFGSSRAL